MRNIVKDLLQMQSQLRIYHWQTKSYSAHKALGKAYETLDGLIDTFVETAMGRSETNLCDANMNIELFDSAALNVHTALDAYKEFLSSINNKLNPGVDSDLLNIRDEMLGVLNQTSYLLKLT